MTMAAHLNYHHLQYFWSVARDGQLTRTAERLRVSQSALSAQIRQLEAQMGVALFERTGRRLVLTEAGKIALSYADEIFSAGNELVSTLREGRRRQHTLRVGAVATLSRNFQRSFVRPLLAEPSARLRLSSGSLDELLAQLEGHALDVVLSNRPSSSEARPQLRSRRLARQPASIVSSHPWPGFRFPQDLPGQPMVLPGLTSDLRSDFDALCGGLGVRVRVLAEVDDMATIRLLARDSGALALVPSIVVRDELREGQVHELCVVPELSESFYAITLERRYQHPLLEELLERDEQALLTPGPEDDAPDPRAERARRGPRKRSR
jgi:LysR family transcriptional activator of nhaA